MAPEPDAAVMTEGDLLKPCHMLLSLELQAYCYFWVCCWLQVQALLRASRCCQPLLLMAVMGASEIHHLEAALEGPPLQQTAPHLLALELSFQAQVSQARGMQAAD